MAGITAWLGRLGTLGIVVSAGFIGVDFLVGGDPTGWIFLGVAAAAVVLQEYVTRPSDVPGSVASRVVGRVAKTPEEEED